MQGPTGSLLGPHRAATGGVLDKGTKDLLVIIVIMVIIIAGFYIVLRMGIDFSEVLPDTMSHASVQSPRS